MAPAAAARASVPSSIVQVPPVVVAFDDPLARESVALACERHGLELAAAGTGGAWAIEQCAQLSAPVLIAGTELDDGPLEEFLGAIRAAGAEVIVLSDDARPERFISLVERGVAGHLRFTVNFVQVVEAVTAVSGGGAALDPGDAAAIVQQWRRLRVYRATQGGVVRRGALTARELDVLEAMADGLATKGIARRLGVAPKTVENHKARVFDKLGVRNQAQAVAYAIAEGLLTRRAAYDDDGDEP